MSNIESPQGYNLLEQYEKEVNERLNWLKNNIKLNTDPWITKYPKKLENWAVVFEYKNMWWKREITTKKQWNKYQIMIRRFNNGKWNVEKFWNSTTFDFNATSESAFNRQLWVALNRIIGKDRDRLPNTWSRVYTLLNWEQRNTPAKHREKRDPNIAPEWLRMENWVYVYRVQPWDARSKLIEKLGAYRPLSYLNNWYWWKSSSAKSFNVWEYLPDSKFHAWVDLIVPNEKFIKTVSEFRNTQLTAIERMKRNSVYWDKIKKLFKSKREWGFWLSEREVANVMTAYARSESSGETLNDKIWECALFRYEPSQVFSYGYHHVLKDWAWENAFKALNFTVWDACDPMKSGMLFLAFCIEKRRNDYQKFFDINHNLAWCAEHYNWPRYKDNKYDTKLKNNYEYVKWIR